MDVRKPINERLPSALFGPQSEGSVLVDGLVAELRTRAKDPDAWTLASNQYDGSKAILGAKPELQIESLIALIAAASKIEGIWSERAVLVYLIGELMKRKLPIVEDDAVRMLQAGGRPDRWLTHLPLAHLMLHVVRIAGKGKLAPLLAEPLKLIAAELKKTSFPEHRGLAERIARLTSHDDLILQSAGLWCGAVFAALGKMEPAERAAWMEFFAHALSASGAKPSKKWLDAAGPHVEKIGVERFRTRLAEWLGLGPRPDTKLGSAVPERDADTIRGTVWCAARYADVSVASAIGHMAESCFKKIPEIGAVSSKAGNACIWALGQLEGNEAVAQLSRLKARVKYTVALRLVEKALLEASTRAGVTVADLEEMSVPTYGLDPAGVVRRTLGPFTAEARIAGEKCELVWRVEGSAKAQKSVPAEVKRDHPEELKDFKKTITEIERAIPAHRDRLERLAIFRRTWRFEEWRARYADHPLVGVVARRLIWSFEGPKQHLGLGIVSGDAILDVDGRKLDAGPATSVRLWHPIGFDAGTVLAWRRRLQTMEIVQPFKQAHREIYSVDATERASGTLSDRFAGHIVRQHQLAALLRQRGWTYRLQGGFDSYNAPTLQLPEWGLQAQFAVEPDPDAGEMSASGIFLHLVTRDVSFWRNVAGGDIVSIALEDVPALAFSEVMRDVDLFSWVPSIGSDLDWTDDGRNAAYWQAAAFGPLSAAAITRRAVLEGLLPSLRIAGKLVLDDRFLWVTGTRGRYGIHLGSGAVLLGPDGRSLRIPDRNLGMKDREGLFLPFEGDSTLPVILAEAFLLAADDKIKDPALVAQLREA